MYPLQWMGAVRMRVHPTDKNITSNPHDSSPTVNILWKAGILTLHCLICIYSLLTHDVFIGESNTMNTDFYFSQMQHLKNFIMIDLFLINAQFSFHKMLINGLELVVDKLILAGLRVSTFFWVIY